MRTITDAVAALLSSRKFIILLLTVAVLAPLVWMGKLTLEQFGHWLTTLSAVMIGAIAVEGAAEKWNAPPPTSQVPAPGAADSLKPPPMPPTLPLLCLALMGCATVRQDEASARYTAQLTSCVVEYDAGPARDACQNEVRRKWGRLDGGADQ